MPDILSQNEINQLLAHKKRILIVNDSVMMRNMISDPLGKTSDWMLVSAENGQKALEMLAERPYDLVITDWDIPDMDGLALIREIRAHKKFELLPVLMATSRNSKIDVTAAVRTGTSDYLIVPFDTEDTLNNKVVRLLTEESIPKEISSDTVNNLPEQLTQMEIDAALGYAGKSRKAKPKPRANKPIITYDFKHPRRVSKDQQRTLENLKTP